MKELALLEIELLTKVEWRIIPQTEKLAEYYRQVVARNPEYVLEGEDEGISDGGESSGVSAGSMDTDTKNGVDA